MLLDRFTSWNAHLCKVNHYKDDRCRLVEQCFRWFHKAFHFTVFSQPGHHVTRGSARGSQVEGSFFVGSTRVPLQNRLAPIEERS